MPHNPDAREKISISVDPYLLRGVDRALITHRIKSRSEFFNQAAARMLLDAQTVGAGELDLDERDP